MSRPLIYPLLASLGIATHAGGCVGTIDDGSAVEEPGDIDFDGDGPTDAGDGDIRRGRPGGVFEPFSDEDYQGGDVFDPLAPPDNPWGIGLVNAGNASDWDRAQELSGEGGHVKLIFAGVHAGMTSAKPEWIDTVNQVYARDLIPVIRIAPDWGDLDIRNQADDASVTSFVQLASAYAQVIDSLPMRESWPMVIEVHNEPNLCYEWKCDAGTAPPHPDAPDGWMHYSNIAGEYAYFLRDIADAIHALGDDRLIVINGGLAPGGTVACECGGDGFKPGITSLEFLAAMKAAVPDIFSRIDAFGSHPYPSQGHGWGFWTHYDTSAPGIYYYQNELAETGVDHDVYITETGWPIARGEAKTREEVADWTVQAMMNDWVPDGRVKAIMPFMLRDTAWDDFAWVDSAGNPHPVFNAVRQARCDAGVPEPC